MSMSFEDLMLSGDGQGIPMFSPHVTGRTFSSYFAATPSSTPGFAADSDSPLPPSSMGGLNMEETVEFNDLVVPVSFHDLLGLDGVSPLNNPMATSTFPSDHHHHHHHLPGFSLAHQQDDGPASVDVESIFKKEEEGEDSFSLSASGACGDGAESPESLLEDDSDYGDANSNWERDLERLLCEFDGQVPIDEKLKEELLTAAVKDFNRRTKAMKLDQKTVHFLKVQRKRVKNRLAAIRSRSRKETQVVDLQERVDNLAKENKTQKQTIHELHRRLDIMAKELQKNKGKGKNA